MWLCMTMTDGRIGIARESDVDSVAAHPKAGYVQVKFREGPIDDVTLLTFHDDMRDAMAAMVAQAESSQRKPCGECHLQSGELCDVCGAAESRKCRVCSCTDDDCSQCVEKTGMPCRWVEADLCSACAIAAGPPVEDTCVHGQSIYDGCGFCAAKSKAAATKILYCPTCGSAGNYDGEWCGQCGTDHKPRTDEGDGCVYKSADCQVCPPADPREPDCLSPLQDGNHPQLQAHRQRMGEAAGDPMASAKALLEKRRPTKA